MPENTGSAMRAAPTAARGTAADQGSMAPPAIESPKGGGAIRGVGEKFAANPVTGTGSVTVPIAVSPGRSGFGPKLELSYDSASGNGSFGFGWHVPLPCVTRKTDKGLPRYGSDDVFILSGVEDLVPVSVQDGQGAWIPDVVERNGYKVEAYRPRIEGLFARIERWTRLLDGDAHWRSISKDNVLTVYGLDLQSRIADPEDPSRVFSWLICHSYDDKGNAICYDYLAENDDGIDQTAAHERNRVRGANRYPYRIRYGNRTPLLLDPTTASFRQTHVPPPDFAAADWMFEVVFDYGLGLYSAGPPDQDGRVLVDAGTAPSAPWPVRADPFSAYRAGFEVRTYRLCRRVLMFHHFPDELGVPDYLVGATAFQYREKGNGSLLEEVAACGYRRQPDGRYLERRRPGLSFDYSPCPLEDPGYDGYQMVDIDAVSARNLPVGLDEDGYRWVDLDGEGISGVLTRQADAWFYKPNLGAGAFGPVERVAARPAPAGKAGGQRQLVDLAGVGQLDLVDFAATSAGFQPRTEEAGWDRFQPFSSWPTLSWTDPDLKLVDVTGDGLADILITGDECLVWHPSLGYAGFGAAARVQMAGDEERGPRVAFADGTQSIHLADLSGDGLTDIVRIRNGDVCYWPNLGYGRFGAKITMDGAPHFDRPELFDQRRIRLADTDGSGTADLIYLGRDGVRVYLNESGNGWSAARTLPQFPVADDHAYVSVVDLLGRGTACLHWSSPLPGDARRSMRYVDLMDGRKPHLLVGLRNNLGAETVVEYASTTEFFLADKAAGTPWITRLPFPMHVVRRIETYDRVGRNRFVTRYSYHHGHFDGVEREFRGFGRVEQLDTEEFGALTATGDISADANVDASTHVPPVLTKTWYHTGVFAATAMVSRQFEHEYYREGDPVSGADPLPGEALLLDDTVLPDGLTAEEARQACRSLRGHLLRREVYALDAGPESGRPYTVSEHNHTIGILQPLLSNEYAMFFTHVREEIDLDYDRKLATVAGKQHADPRVAHSATLDLDQYGNVLLAAVVGYGHRFDDPDVRLTAADRSVQKRPLITVTERTFTNLVHELDAWRVPQPAQTRRYELHNVTPATTVPSPLFRFDELRNAIAAAGDGAHDLPYQDFTGAGATGNAAFRRLIGHERVLYRRNDLTGALGLGQVEALALPHQTHRLAMTAVLAAELFVASGKLTLLALDTALTVEGGYVHSLGDSGWWVPGRRVAYSPNPADSPSQELAQASAHFFRVRRYTDPFGHVSVVDFDPHDLLVVAGKDPVGNVATVGERDVNDVLVANGNDYRTLRPALVMDANRNRTAVAFDALGQVVGNAKMGKPEESLGDSLVGFEPDLSDVVNSAHMTDPQADPQSILGRATTRVVYDLFAYARTEAQPHPQPAVSCTIARETHDADLRPGAATKVQLGLSYSDGFEREIQKKAPAKPGPLTEGGPTVTPRWVSSGWTVFNNKGKAVRTYEPFFTADHAFAFGNLAGVSPITCYDPVGRTVAVVHPNHAWEKVHFEPWRQDVWDVNDTVSVVDPTTDADVGALLARLPAADYLPTWYAARQGGALGAAEQGAATKAMAHAGTPEVSFLDPLGRIFLTVAYNRFPGAAPSDPPIEEFHRTRLVFDIAGNQREVFDAKDRLVMRYDCDLLGNRVRHASMEAGTSLHLVDVDGRQIRRWDDRGHVFTFAYDGLRRPVRRLVRGTDAVHSDPRVFNKDVLYEKIEYGEGQLDDVALNLRTRVVATYDGVGLDRTQRYDFKGNPMRVSRQLAADHTAVPDWAHSPVLESETFTSSTTYDALNRALTLTTPDGSVTNPAYNVAGLLDALSVRLRGAATATGFVTDIDYNAKGQRIRVKAGNGAFTDHSYDPDTFRLTGITTTRPSPGNGLLAQLFTAGTKVQDLRYTYDAAGNVTTAADTALKTFFYNGEMVEPVRPFTYDAVYRLIEAGGREHLSQSAVQSVPDGNYRDYPFVGAHHLADVQALRNYTDRYAYDQVGNITSVTHRATNGNWTRTYAYAETSLLEPSQVSNRLSGTTMGSAEPYSYDPHGAVTAMPHLSTMEWDFKGQLRATARQVVNEAMPERTYYVYSASGQRTRKVTVRGDGTRKNERCYLRGFERYRTYAGDGITVTMARETLHLMAGEWRAALVETLTAGNANTAMALRYQFGDHLRSVALELDETAGLISYEEYTPYGESAYQAGRSAAEVSLKRFRYTGKERDEETGFTYHEARYCAPWLGRWVSCDPAGLADGPNLYQYARSNPCRLADPAGAQAREPQNQGARVPDPVPGDKVEGHEQAGAGADAKAGGAQGQPGDASAQSGGQLQPADPAQSAEKTTGDAVAVGKSPADTPSAKGAGAPTRPAAKQDVPWLNRETKIEYKNWKERDWRSYVLAILFIALALAVAVPLAKKSSNDPLWFKIVRLFGTEVAVFNLGVRALIDFGTKEGGKQAAQGDHRPLDLWSIVHTSAGVIMGLWRVPFPVMAGLTVSWEVFEMSVPGFGDHEINANRMTDILLAWAGWFTAAGIASQVAKTKLPLGQPGSW